MGDDRDVILRRRKRFVVAALAAGSVAGLGDAACRPCLDVAAPEAGAGGDGGTSGASSTPDDSGGAEP